MKQTIYALFAVMLCACSTSKSGDTPTVNTDETYGYTQTNPIKVGGFKDGPANERDYLNSLSGPNGEELVYKRSGSCCNFETKNSPFGMGLLDIYRVTYAGKKDTITLYINMYDKAKLKAPVGFKFR